jgi:hypothetical protein
VRLRDQESDLPARFSLNGLDRRDRVEGTWKLLWGGTDNDYAAASRAAQQHATKRCGGTRTRGDAA